MPSYRGVSQADLIKSINDALELLETHSPGPVTQANIDKLRAVDPATNQSPLGAIAAAADDAALAAAMRGTWKVLGFMSPVFRFHALDDTDGKGLDVYKRLGAFGALSGARDMAYHPEDGEMDSYLTVQYAHKLAAKMPVVTGLKNIFWSVAANGRDGFGASRKLNSLVRQARRGASDADLTDKFLKLDIRDRHLVVDAASAALGLHDGQKSKLPEVDCMGYYGLVIPELGKSLNWGSPEVGDLSEKVQTIIEPFFALDEVNMCGVGGIGFRMDGPQGVTFGSTLRVAQAVKAAFPDMEVVDHKGNKIELPPAPSAAPNAAPKP